MRARVGAWVGLAAIAMSGVACGERELDARVRAAVHHGGARSVSPAPALPDKVVLAGEPSLPPLATALDPFAYDAAAPLNVAESPGAAGAIFTTTNVTYQTYDGAVPARFFAPLVPAPYPCVLVAHGVTGHKDSDHRIRDRLVAHGYAMFSIDARYHGDRVTDPEFEEIRFFPGRARELFQGTVVDLRRALDYLTSRNDCAQGRIGFIGSSMGGFIGAMLAGADARVTAPVLLFSGGDWRTWFETGDAGVVGIFHLYDEPRSREAVAVALDPLDPVHWVGRVSPRPVLMIHGDRDTVVPPASAEALDSAARDPKEVVWYRGGHGPGPDEAARVTQIVADWLERFIRAS